jgi:hypothetical protein
LRAEENQFCAECLEYGFKSLRSEEKRKWVRHAKKKGIPPDCCAACRRELKVQAEVYADRLETAPESVSGVSIASDEPQPVDSFQYKPPSRNGSVLSRSESSSHRSQHSSKWSSNKSSECRSESQRQSSDKETYDNADNEMMEMQKVRKGSGILEQVRKGSCCLMVHEDHPMLRGLGDKHKHDVWRFRSMVFLGDDRELRNSHRKKGMAAGHPGLPQMVRWARSESWLSFFGKPYMDWMLPVDFPSPLFGDDWICEKEVVRALSKDNYYMQSYRQVCSLVFMALGFNIPFEGGNCPIREIYHPDPVQKWNKNKTWRLRHALLSTRLFGLKYLSQRIADVAHFLNDKGDLMLEEDGRGRALNQLPVDGQGEKWYQTVLAPLKPITMEALLKKYAKSTDISLFSRSAPSGPIQRRLRSQGLLEN